MLGDTSAGVRTSCPGCYPGATWAVWLQQLVITNSNKIRHRRGLLFNLMPMIAVESGVATPDSPEICGYGVGCCYSSRRSPNGSRSLVDCRRNCCRICTAREIYGLLPRSRDFALARRRARTTALVRAPPGPMRAPLIALVIFSPVDPVERTAWLDFLCHAVWPHWCGAFLPCVTLENFSVASCFSQPFHRDPRGSRRIMFAFE